MVEYSMPLDILFGALADSTRRDILQRLTQSQLTIGQIAAGYDLTFAAISKHLKVLEKAQLIAKRRRGKEQVVSITPENLLPVAEYIEAYRHLWERRFDSLEQYLSESKE